MDVFRVRPAAQLHVQFRQAGGQRLADELAGGGGSVGGETAPGAGEFPLWISGAQPSSTKAALEVLSGSSFNGLRQAGGMMSSRLGWRSNSISRSALV